MKTRIGTALLVLASVLYALGDALATAGDGYDKVAPMAADKLGDIWGWIGDHTGSMIVHAACCLALLYGLAMAIKREAPALARICVIRVNGVIGAIESFAHEVAEMFSNAWAFRGEILAEGRA